MKTFILLDRSPDIPAGAAQVLGATSESPGDSAQVRTAYWDRSDVPEGRLSVPAELAARIVSIRAELAAWTYETGTAEVCGRPLEHHLRGGEDRLSLWWCSTLMDKHPRVTLNLFPALKLRALELLIEEGNCARLVLVSPDPVLAAILERFCTATGRTFVRLEPALRSEVRASGRESGLRGLYRRLPAPLQAVVHFGHWLCTIRRYLPRTTAPAPEPGTLCGVTYFPNIDPAAARKGRFRSRYWERLHEVLDPGEGGKGRVNWVFLYFPSPQCTLSEAVRLRNGFRACGRDGASFHFLEEFLDAGDIGRSLLRFVRTALAGLRVQGAVRRRFFLPGSHMDLWPLLRRNWADSTRGWRALERCLTEAAFVRCAAWCGPQAATFFPQENCPWERQLCKAVHDAGNGPVYGAQHSTVRAADFRYFDDPRLLDEPSCRTALPDLWLCNGRGAYEALCASGMPETRLTVVEALRYLYLNDMRAAPRAEHTGERRLLAVTSFFADETEAHLRVLAETVRTGGLDGWSVRLKAHPYLPVNERLRELFPHGDGPELVDRPLGELLVPGVTVWASNSTTAALEAAFLKLPLLVQAPDDDVDLCPLQDVPGLVVVRNAAEAGAALERRAVPEVPPDYLCLDPELPRWKRLLRLG